MCSVVGQAGATVIFDGSGFVFKDPEGTVAAGPNGGTQFEFDAITDGDVTPAFFNTGFAPPNTDPIPGGNASGTLRVTARQLAGNDPASAIYVVVGEPNPDFIFEGNPTPRRELHSYELLTGLFSDTSFTTIDIPLSNTFSITSTDLSGGGFSPNGVGENPTQEFNIRGTDFVLFQSLFPGGGGSRNIEILTIEIVPEPASLGLMGVGALALVRRRR